MRFAAIHFQLPIYTSTEPIVRNHSADGAFDQQFRMASASRPGALSFVSADVTGKAHITFLFFFLSGESDFFRVDDNDKIARVHMRCKNGFLFATQQISRFYSDFSVPGRLRRSATICVGPRWLWQKTFSSLKRAQKLRERQGPVNLSVTDFIDNCFFPAQIPVKNTSWRLRQSPYNCGAFL